MISSDLALNDNAQGLNDTIFEYTPGLVKKRYKRCTKCRGFGHSVTVCHNKRSVTLEEVRQIDQMLEAERLEYSLNVLRREHEEERRDAHEPSFELSHSTFQVLNTSKDVVLDSNPIFDSYELEEQSELLLDLFPKDHGVEAYEKMVIDPHPTQDLFHDASIDHGICDLNDPPLFDSYEQEIEEVNSINGFTNEVLAESRGIGPNSNSLRDQIESSTSILIGGPFFLLEEANSGSDHGDSDLNMLRMNLISPVATQNEQLEASAVPSSYFLAQSGPTGCYADSANNISSTKSQEQPRANNFKNCYIFKRKGLHSVLNFMMEIIYEARVQDHEKESRLKNCYTFKKKGVHSDIHLLLTLGAQAEAIGKAHVLLFLDLYGGGLLDLYIEDDELIDKREGTILSPSMVKHPYELKLRI